MARKTKIRWLFAASLLLLFTCCFPWHMFYWAEFEPIPLPDGAGELVLLAKGLHPFLAESARRIRLKSESSDMLLDLAHNVGGQDVVDVYWYPADEQRGPFVRLEDHWGEYLIDVNKRRSYSLWRVEDTLFAGDCTTSGGAYSWSASEDEAVFNRQPAVVVEPPVSNSSGLHLGRFE